MEFYASDVYKITGVKRTRLQQWLERGFVSPSINVADGHGSRNIYSRSDLYIIAIFKRVSEMGLPRKVAADMISMLHRYSKAQPISKLGGLGGLFDLTKYIMYVRFGEESASEIIMYDETYSIDKYFKDVTKRGPEFEDCYMINFHTIKKAIDLKINEVITY